MTRANIFLSYSRANMDVADTIEADLNLLGIKIIRDIRDLHYKKSIKDFMSSVRDSDFVISIVSDAFLTSVNCMYEVLELFKEKTLKRNCYM